MVQFNIFMNTLFVLLKKYFISDVMFPFLNRRSYKWVRKDLRQRYCPYAKKLFHIAQTHTLEEEEAEDAVQEVLLKLWHTRDSLQNYDNAAALQQRLQKITAWTDWKWKKNRCAGRYLQRPRRNRQSTFGTWAKNTEEILKKSLLNSGIAAGHYPNEGYWRIRSGGNCWNNRNKARCSAYKFIKGTKKWEKNTLN